MIFVRPYAISTGAKRIAHFLEGRRIRTKNSNYRYKPSHSVINWGSTRDFNGQLVLNQPSSVRKAVNKLYTYVLLKARDVPTLEFTESKEEAKRWNAEGKTIYARKTLTGQGGAGIVVIQP
ncbi:MAG: hypothetical protein ACYC9D_12975, partial [Candidatus Dormibacteria bacterium]